MKSYNSKELKYFWNNYYSSQSRRMPNSSFSEFVLNYIKEPSGKSLLDIGCGDGRDSVYFANNKIQTEGIDFSTSALNNKNNNNNKLLKFTELDLLDIDKLNNSYDYAYCRFLFHAISEDIEDVILKWLRKNIKNSIFIETRIHNKLQPNVEETHYRRYFTEEEFKKTLKKYNHNIIFSESSRNFSKYKKIYNVEDLKDDPLLLRLIIE